MFKIVSKINSDIKRIVNEVIYYNNYLHTFYFDESKELLDHINSKQLNVFQVYLEYDVPNSSMMDSHLNTQINLLGIFTIKEHVRGGVLFYQALKCNS